MIQSLVLTRSREDEIKTQLQKSITRKKKILESWMAKAEFIRFELEIIKHEYNVRIGYLLLKDNQLDLEIIQMRNLLHLMSEGKSYEEAQRIEEDKFYNEILRMQKEQETLEEEKELLQKRDGLTEDMQKELKTIWKKLMRKFHPDLVQDKEEKTKRDSYMKQINKAYSEGNLTFLKTFSVQQNSAANHATSIEDLEQILIDIENMTEHFRHEIQTLRSSEWWGWKKKIEKAKKDAQDVFAPLEKSILDDISKKIVIAQELRIKVGKASVGV